MIQTTKPHAGNSARATQSVVVPRAHDTSKEDFEAFVRQSLSRNVTLSTLASECNMSLSRFKSHFQWHFGTSPHRWITRERLILAQRLLLTTDHPIKTIAYECGFSSPSHLIRLFHKHFGLSPALYRSEFRDKFHLPSPLDKL